MHLREVQDLASILPGLQAPSSELTCSFPPPVPEAAVLPNPKVQENLEILLERRSWFSRARVEPAILHFQQASRLRVAGPRLQRLDGRAQLWLHVWISWELSEMLMPRPGLREWSYWSSVTVPAQHFQGFPKWMNVQLGLRLGFGGNSIYNPLRTPCYPALPFPSPRGLCGWPSRTPLKEASPSKLPAWKRSETPPVSLK